MSTEYVSQDEIEAHEAAMQRAVEYEMREQEAINDKKNRAIMDSDDNKKWAIMEADRRMRKAIEEAKRENASAIKAANQVDEYAVKAAEMKAEQKQKWLKQAKDRKLVNKYATCIPLRI